MSVEENKAIERRFFEEVVNKGDLAVLDELLATNFVDHSAPPGVAPDREGYKQFSHSPAYFYLSLGRYIHSFNRFYNAMDTGIGERVVCAKHQGARPHPSGYWRYPSTYNYYWMC